VSTPPPTLAGPTISIEPGGAEDYAATILVVDVIPS
jgi:hypothetical protein